MIVKEAYAETDIPVLKESPVGYSLNFNTLDNNSIV